MDSPSLQEPKSRQDSPAVRTRSLRRPTEGAAAIPPAAAPTGEVSGGTACARGERALSAVLTEKETHSTDPPVAGKGRHSQESLRSSLEPREFPEGHPSTRRV